MIRSITLAGALALMTLAGCSNEIDDSNLEGKADAVEVAVTPDAEAEEIVDEYGPTFNELMPVSKLLDSVTGQSVELADLIGPQGGVVVFSRSAAWCPYCQKQMVELNQAVEKLDELEMKLTVITYDSVKDLSEFRATNGINYSLVSDTDSTTIIASNLLNEGVEQGTRFYGIPHPAVIVLGAIGEVKDVNVDTNYKVRPSVADILLNAESVRNAG